MDEITRHGPPDTGRRRLLRAAIALPVGALLVACAIGSSDDDGDDEDEDDD